MKRDYILDEKEMLTAVSGIGHFLDLRVSELERYIESIDRILGNSDESPIIKDKNICKQLEILRTYADNNKKKMEEIRESIGSEIHDLVKKTKEKDNFNFPVDYDKFNVVSKWGTQIKKLNPDDRIKDYLRSLDLDIFDILGI
jgi:hypothetical protein